MKQFFSKWENSKKTAQGKAKSGQLYLCYTILFVLMSSIVFLPFLQYDKTLLTTDDGFLQWYSVLVKMKSVVIDFFNGNGFSFWSWDTGLGSDLFGNYAVVLFDPFNYLVLLFPKEYIDIAYSVICILKMYTAGIVMIHFLNYHKKARLLCLIGALAYVFCAWTFYGLRHDFFMTQMILFPLLIYGVDRVEDKKSPLLLILSVMFTIINSVYFSYMSAMFVAIYVILKFVLSEEKKSVALFFKKIGCYVGYVVVGAILLSAPVLVSALKAITSTSTGSGVDIQILPNLKQILRFIPAFAGNLDIHNNYTAVGMSALIVLMIPAMILLRKKKKISIWMFAITVIFAFFPILGSVTNGFSYSAGRWCYVLSFFFVYAAVDCLQSEVIFSPQFLRWAKIWLGVILTSSLVAMLVVKAILIGNFALISINLIFGLFIYAILSKKEWSGKKKMYSCFAIFVINTVLVPYCSFNPNISTKLNEYMTVGKCYELYESCGMKAAKEIKDDEFFRIDSVEKPSHTGENISYATTPANTNIYWEVPTIFQYMSSLDNNWLLFNQQMGNNGGYYRRVSTYANDNRARMDFLLGVKYFLGDNNEKGFELSQYAGYGFESIGEKQNVEILKSKYNASLGYVYDSVISESEYMSYSPLEREQILMQAALVKDADVENVWPLEEVMKEELTLEQQEIATEVKSLDGTIISDNNIEVVKANGQITIELKEEIQDSEVYLVFENLRRTPYTPEELWEMRVKASQTQWEMEKLVGYATDDLAKQAFFSGYLSYTEYADITITAQKDNVIKRVMNVEGDVRAIRDIDDFMINMGYMKEGTGTITCTLGQLGKYTFDNIKVMAVPTKGFDEQAKQLERNRLNVTEYGDNRVKGYIDTEKDGLLYLSILYNEGWSIYVDGKEVEEKHLVNTAFTGVEVPAGHHDIELVYRPIGFRVCLYLFAIGVISLVGICLYHRKRSRRDTGEEDINRHRTV